MKVLGVIPARFDSSRFPGKPLKVLLGKPMVLWVAELSAKVVGKENVYIATENNKIFNTAIQAGFKSIMTSVNCLTGTDRVAEVAKKIKADIYVNVQGDEPLVNPEDIKKIIKKKKKYFNEIVNGYTIIGKNEDQNNVNIPKVIFTNNKILIYISRQAIPGFKEKKNEVKVFYKQVCIYAFNRKELAIFKKYNRKSILEKCEDIEILRFFELDKKIRLVQTGSGSLAIDEPCDVDKVEAILKKKEKHN
jgi:3-deoxy-manno-octulosonate cytidylyltransferase (CMP-KDO synthetase)